MAVIGVSNRAANSTATVTAEFPLWTAVIGVSNRAANSTATVTAEFP